MPLCFIPYNVILLNARRFYLSFFFLAEIRHNRIQTREIISIETKTPHVMPMILIRSPVSARATSSDLGVTEKKIRNSFG